MIDDLMNTHAELMEADIRFHRLVDALVMGGMLDAAEAAQIIPDSPDAMGTFALVRLP